MPDDLEEMDPLPPGAPLPDDLTEHTPDYLPHNHPDAMDAIEIKAQAEKDRDDVVIQEWAEERLIAALPLEQYVDAEQEEQLVELICDGVGDAAPDLIDFLRSRV